MAGNPKRQANPARPLPDWRARPRMNDHTDTAPASSPASPSVPTWYPYPTWSEDPESWFFVPEVDRAEYARVALTDDDARRWMQPTKAMTAAPITSDLPPALRWADVGVGPGPDGEPTTLGYLESAGGMAAVAALQHSHALAEARQAREAAAMQAAADAASRVGCAVCSSRIYRWDAARVAGVYLCAPCVPAVVWAIGTVASTRQLADGTTAGDRALTLAGQLAPGATITPPTGTPDLSAAGPVFARPAVAYVGPGGEATPVPDR